ncbi:MAG: hypothetical protein WA790_01435 [Sulfitobacter sp.]
MLQRHVQFDGTSPTLPDEAVRLDVACFLGYLALRKDAVADDALVHWLDRQGYLSRAEKDGVTPVGLIDRPIPIRSLADAEAWFDLDLRLDRVAVLEGGAIPQDLGEATLAPFAVTIDGGLHEVDLSGLPSDVNAIAQHLDQQFPDLDIWVQQRDGENRLRLRRTQRAGPGTLSVLAHPVLGFHTSQHTAARRVGTAMGAALRQFFAMGGQQAYVVSFGVPAPVLSPADARADKLAALLDLQSHTGTIDNNSFQSEFPAAHIDAAERSGLTHLFGLEDLGALVMPDLPDLVGSDDVILGTPDTGLRPLAGFAECLPPPPAATNAFASVLPLPMCAPDGAAIWGAALSRVTRFLEGFRRDVMMMAAVPETQSGLDIAPLIPRSELLMIAAPFVVTPASNGLPGGAMGGDAVLLGHVARLLLSDAPHGSMAAAPLAQVNALSGNARAHLDMICRLEKGPRDIRYTADLTTDGDQLWRAAPARRMMQRLLKHAARMGNGIVFEPISDGLMRQIAMSFETVLQDIQQSGGLRPGRDDPGFSVICNRTNNPERERDQGRIRADISFRAAVPIEMIRVSLPISGGFRSDGSQP